MSDTAPIARSPIAPIPPTRVEAGWEVSDVHRDGPLTLTDHTPLVKMHVRAPAEGTAARILDVPFGRSARPSVGGLVVGSGPDEWFVFGAPDAAESLRERVTHALAPAEADELVTVIDLTHGRALVRLTGALAPDLLAKLCAIDFDDRATPDGTAFRSSVAHLVTDVIRDDREGVQSYLLHCETSSGQYLFDCLVDAGREFGLVISGFVGPGI